MREPRAANSISNIEAEADERSGAVVRAILTLLATCSPDERERVQRALAKYQALAPTKKSGDAAGVILKLVPKAGDWSIEELKKKALSTDADANPKQIYNTIAYLAKKGLVERLSYGKYRTIDGLYFETLEELDLAPHRREGDSDD